MKAKKSLKKAEGQQKNLKAELQNYFKTKLLTCKIQSVVSGSHTLVIFLIEFSAFVIGLQSAVFSSPTLALFIIAVSAVNCRVKKNKDITQRTKKQQAILRFGRETSIKYERL